MSSPPRLWLEERERESRRHPIQAHVRSSMVVSRASPAGFFLWLVAGLLRNVDPGYGG